ncbi:MAG: toast rack family protein [Chloroflexota bacterium]
MLLSFLGLGIVACQTAVDIPRQTQVGSVQTAVLDEPYPALETAVALTLTLQTGQLNISSGADRLITGTIRYNVEEWEPVITRSADAGRLTIAQPSLPDHIIPSQWAINDWELALGRFPLRLAIEGGNQQSYLDLSDVPLHQLTIREGPADSDITFTSPNPVIMEQFTYNTGASNVRLEGLGYANFTRFDFVGGAGTFLLDFSGPLQQDAHVHLQAGLSTVRLVIPAETAVRISFINEFEEITTVGDWQQDGFVYAAEGTGPLLTVEVDMEIGAVTLVRE